MSEDPKNEISIHVTTSGETRNPIGSKASPNIFVGCEDGGPWMIGVTQDGQPFDPTVLGVEDPLLSHLEEYIQTHALGGIWKLHIVAPLWDATWERNAEGDWLCVLAGLGYA